MKHILLFILFFTVLTASAQAEFNSGFKPIPARKFDAKPKKIPAPEFKDPQAQNTDIPSIKTPNVFDNTTITPKSKFQIGEEKSNFSMSTENKFGNPGDRYVGKMEKDLDQALTDAGLKEDRGQLVRKNLEFGNIYTGSSYFVVKCRDVGAIDGDLIKAVFNQNVLVEKMILRGDYQEFKIIFNEGFNTFDIEALNRGSLGGNTGGFEFYDAEGHLILSDSWDNLDTGFKAKFIIIKEDKVFTKGKKTIQKISK
ncbi:hypothetical protein [Flavobacterium hydrophilum]|uniref:Uncharacterized protein n=1 Tax=Flavobacterium hydrophilum TaxID=2211445 RepID=A0A2V4CCE7_9FLAO|nr:hypothetical protein [Flavobacterium hydrophilum]PXY43794.1 hypothetical protein DMB68_19640 [Flavobacterium hydrophilum]